MMSFKEFFDLKEANHNNHGGDRSTHRSQITRMTPKFVSPHKPKHKKHKTKLFQI